MQAGKPARAKLAPKIGGLADSGEWDQSTKRQVGCFCRYGVTSLEGCYSFVPPRRPGRLVFSSAPLRNVELRHPSIEGHPGPVELLGGLALVPFR